jgi:hypothetical protein
VDCRFLLACVLLWYSTTGQQQQKQLSSDQTGMPTLVALRRMGCSTRQTLCWGQSIPDQHHLAGVASLIVTWLVVFACRDDHP